MTQVVDPFLFRLLAFRADWIEPLKALLGSPEDAPLHLLSQEMHGSKVRLGLVLLLEAESWIAIGQEVGYFPPASATAEPLGRVEVAGEGLEQLRNWEAFVPFVFESYAETFGLVADIDSPAAFAHALSQALDDLTPEHMEFLRLFYFAEPPEWSKRLADVQEFARALQARPGSSLSREALDRVAWCLGGAESQIGRENELLPAYWRTQIGWESKFVPAFWRTPEYHFLFEDRYSEVGALREEIFAATTWIAEDERTSAQLQIAAALRGRNETELARSLLLEREQQSM